MIKDPEHRKRYQRQWYLANRDRLIKKKNERKKRAKQYIWTLKESASCLDCKQSYPWYVMEFDHVRETKEFDISKGLQEGYSLEHLLREIEKCDLVCANCHRERTHKKSGWGP